MAKMTLLEMVQDILSELESDEVDSISDTVEAGQVAQRIKTSYFDLVDSQMFPNLRELKQLDGLSDSNYPNYLNIPENVIELLWFNYDVVESGDTVPNYQEVCFLDPQSFMRKLNSRNPDDTNIQSVTDPSGVTLLIHKNKRPQWWTSFDDEQIVCDSYDSGIDSTLQTSKTQAYCEVEPTWTASDTFTPDLPAQMFPLLLSEAKSACFIAFKQQANPKEEQNARRQQRRSRRHKWRTRANHPSSYGPNYGRGRP